MKNFAASRPVAVHFLISFVIASLVIAFAVVRFATAPDSAGAMGRLFQSVIDGPGYINMLTIAAAVPRDPDLFGIFIFAASPTIAAIWLAALGVSGGLPRLLRRLNPVGPLGNARRCLRLYIVMIAIYAAGIFLFDWVAGPGVNAFERLAGFGPPALIGAMIGLFLDEGGTLEELGWRGFAWHALLDAMKSPTGAALVMGVVHWAWHLPREVLTFMGGTSLDAFLMGQLTFLTLTTALAVVCGYCVNVSGGSVIPAIMIHGGTNVWSKAMGDYIAPSFDRLDLRSLILIVLAVVILVFARRRLGLERP